MLKKILIWLVEKLMHEKKDRKVDWRLVVFAILYSIITLGIIYNVESKGESATLVYFLLYFPVFWFFALIALILLLWLGKIVIRGWNVLFLLFSTPVPIIIFIYIYFFVLNPPH